MIMDSLPNQYIFGTTGAVEDQRSLLLAKIHNCEKLSTVIHISG